jgi:propane monooxygenase coupling protein
MTETVQSEVFGAVNRTSSNMCGVTLMNNQNGYVVAEIMSHKDGVEVSEFPSMIRVDGKNSITFDFQEITDALGAEFDQSDFEEIMSTHYGRMVHFDDKTMLFANPEDAAEYIDFDLPVVN